MRLHFCKELSKISCEIDQHLVPDLSEASNALKFPAIKERLLVVLRELYGESSREFRVVKLTNSPATVAKVVDHIIRRTHLISPTTNVVNM
jgi:hypothetical protein